MRENVAKSTKPVEYHFVHATADAVCSICRRWTILKHYLYARSTNGRRKVCLGCWDEKPTEGWK